MTSVWLSVDPLAHKYPSLSPYAFVGNNPINLVDPDGRDIWEIDGKTVNNIFSSDPKNTSEETDQEPKYPSSEELKSTFGPEAIEKIFSYTEQEDFAENHGIDFSKEGQEKLSSLLLGIVINEEQQTDRKTYSGKVIGVTSALADESMIDETFEGVLPESWLPLEIDEFIPNTPSVVNPGLDRNYLPRVDLGDGKSIIFTITVGIIEDL